LSFTTNDPTRASVNYTLQCAGQAGSQPNLQLNPANGGMVSVQGTQGVSRSLTVVFKNIGTGNLTYASPLLTTDPPGAIVSVGSPVPGSQAANSSASSQVFYCDDATPGIKTGKLSFTTNEPGTPTYVVDLVCDMKKAPYKVFGGSDNTTPGFGTVAGIYGVAVSPDGKHVYATDQGDETIIIDAVNADGTLSTAGVFSNSTVSVSNRFTNPIQVLVSPDGRNVYATGNAGDALATFSRDADTGELTHIDTVRDGDGYNCVFTPPLTINCANTVSGLNGAYGIALSPDGSFIYVSGLNSDAVVVFARSASTGAPRTSVFGGPALKQTFTHARINAPYDLAMSPDGKHVYVANYDGGGANSGVVVLTRDPISGTLSYLQAITTSTHAGLVGTFRVELSSDGRFLYTAGYNSDSVCTLERNPINGRLTHKACYTNSTLLNQASDVAIAPDGKRVYVTGYGSDSVVAFDRSIDTGALTYRDFITKNVALNSPRIDGARGVVVHPTKPMVYVSGYTDDRLVAIQLNRPDPLVTALSPASVVAGSGALSLTVKGEDFLPDSVVRFNGSNRPTAYVDATTLIASLTAGDVNAAAEPNITVNTPFPGGGTSAAVKLYVIAANAIPVPVVTSISMPGIPAGSTTAVIEVNGSGFGTGATVIANGSARATARISSTLLRATLIAADLDDIGKLIIKVDNQPSLARADAPDVAPTDSNGVAINVSAPNLNPAAGARTLLPAGSHSFIRRSGFDIMIQGNNFVPGAQALWNGEPRLTKFINASTLIMSVSAADVAEPNSFAGIRVRNPAPGGGESASLMFTIGEPEPLRVMLPAVVR
jgi:6-phosphogluconolactonase (cycloisomerase 2 family)